MKNFITAIGPDMKIISFSNNKNIDKSTEEEITNSIIDSFNEHIFLGDQFKQNIAEILRKIDFAYPNDGVKIQKTFDLFLKSSHKLLENYLKKTLDLYTSFKPEFKSDGHKGTYQTTDIFGNTHFVRNNQWMQDWVEQSNSYNVDFETISSFDGNLDEFYYFTDTDDMN